jgi:hypothetical protein
MAECIPERFEFASLGGAPETVAEFSAGTITSDAGGVLLREADLKMNLLSRFSECFWMDEIRCSSSTEWSK